MAAGIVIGFLACVFLLITSAIGAEPQETDEHEGDRNEHS